MRMPASFTPRSKVDLLQGLPDGTRQSPSQIEFTRGSMPSASKRAICLVEPAVECVRAALSWRADQSQPAGDLGAGLSGAACPDA